MTKLLLERIPDASASERQAVGAAVQSIAQGAAEGDRRLQQAFDFLKKNRIADAARLLKAVAEDKSARAAQETAGAEEDRKEAAGAYRNLGAIAGLGDPKGALEAYEKVVALDPDDLESLLRIGAIQIDYGDLNEAQTRLGRVLALAKADDKVFFRYRAQLLLGDVQVAQGDLAGALKSYRDSLAIADRLAKSDPGNAGWQRDLSVSYGKLADVYLKSRQPAAAQKALAAGRDIVARLVANFPDWAQWKQDLAEFDRQIAALKH